MLLEFPKTLLPGFSWCLKRLQELYSRRDIPFSQHIAPTPSMPVSSPVQQSAYTTQSGFAYDLTLLQNPKKNGVTAPPLHLPAFRPETQNQTQERWLQELRNKTTLDEGQAVALCENLNRDLAFTQGPPGTGKTYLGVSLAKVILASQSKATPKPILTVCMTNHALDGFLQDLLKDGIVSVARLGGGSREEWTKPHLLRELSSRLKRTQIEQSILSTSRLRQECMFPWGELVNKLISVALTVTSDLTAEGIGRCGALSSPDLSWHSVQEYLRLKHPKVYSQFAMLGSSDCNLSELRLARKAGGFAFSHWREGGDIDNLRQLPFEFAKHLGIDTSRSAELSGVTNVKKFLVKVASHTELQAKRAAGDNVWSLSLPARNELINRWSSELDSKVLVEQLVEVHRRHQIALQSKRAAADDIDVRCLEQRKLSVRAKASSLLRFV